MKTLLIAFVLVFAVVGCSEPAANTQPTVQDIEKQTGQPPANPDSAADPNVQAEMNEGR